MQITSGTVSLTNGSPIVVGSGVDWSLVNTSSIIIVSGVPYAIQAVDAENDELTLSADWAGTTASGVSYVIVRDFTTNHSLPMLNPGDLEAAAIFSRAMTLIDKLLATIGGASPGGASAEVLISKTGHGFLVGNVLTQDATGWVLAASATSTKRTPLCVVSEVVDVDSFRVRFTGEITSITGVSSMTAGTIYYLRNAPDAGGGGYYNIVPEGDANIGTIAIPVLLATDTDAGFILTMPSVKSGTFGEGVDGMVPGFGASDAGKVLKTGGWSTGGVANNEVAAEHLKATGSVDWDAFAAQTVGTSILQHILDLQERTEAVEAAQTEGYLKHSNSLVIHSAVSGIVDVTTGYKYDWSFPDGITSVFVNHWFMQYALSGGVHTCTLWKHRFHLRKPSDQSGLRFLMRKPAYLAPIGHGTFILSGTYPMAAVTHGQYSWAGSNSPNTLWNASFAGTFGTATWETITVSGLAGTISGDCYVNTNRGLHLDSSVSAGSSASAYEAWANTLLPAFVSTMQLQTSGGYSAPGPCQTPYNFYNGVIELQY